LVFFCYARQKACCRVDDKVLIFIPDSLLVGMLLVGRNCEFLHAERQYLGVTMQSVKQEPADLIAVVWFFDGEKCCSLHNALLMSTNVPMDMQWYLF
jgi:hypothetical protein